MSNYIYIKSEPTLWTVGFYDPMNQFQSESDHGSTEEAAQRVAFLNGGGLDKIDPNPDEDTEPDVYDELREWMVSESAKSELFRKELKIENEEIRDILVERNALLKPHPDWDKPNSNGRNCIYQSEKAIPNRQPGSGHSSPGCRKFGTCCDYGDYGCLDWYPIPVKQP